MSIDGERRDERRCRTCRRTPVRPSHARGVFLHGRRAEEEGRLGSFQKAQTRSRRIRGGAEGERCVRLLLLGSSSRHNRNCTENKPQRTWATETQGCDETRHHLFPTADWCSMSSRSCLHVPCP
jgi:hypothetical protein